MNDDAALLVTWTETRSEEAFRSLVDRHGSLVYGTALRILGGDSHAAQDVTQAVFVKLAQRAARVNAESLGPWLYRQAWFAAHKMLRQNQRRACRERASALLNSVEPDPGSLWKRVAPCLDEAISRLTAKDRTALVLRFFQQQDFRSVGKALGTNEDAAQKRVSRALEKLRNVLSRQGVSVSDSALSALLVLATGTAVPATVAASATQAALAASAAGTASTALLIHLMTATKLKTALLCSALAAGIALPLWLQHTQIETLSQSNLELRGALKAAQEENDLSFLAGSVDPAAQGPPRDDQFRELLRLRGQSAVLQRQIAELEAREAEQANTQSSTETFIPAESLTFAGYADPASSLQTYFWSLRTGDTNALLRGVSPELAESYSQALNGSEPEFIRRSLTTEVADLKGLKILDTHMKSPSMAVLTVQESGLKERRSLITFLRINEEWRLLDKSSR